MIINVDSQAGVASTDLIPDRAGWTEIRSVAQNATGSAATEVNQKIENSIAYMRSHLNQPLQVATLAGVANISASHFFAMFKRLTGCAPIEFFITLRMRRACDLLDETSVSVKEVAAILGYDDQFYFSRLFKSATHMPPTHYRALDVVMRSTVKDRLTPSYHSEATTIESL
jgi:transcriptional regulator GlxA family with amidase domain